jgi:hypothetical protein
MTYYSYVRNEELERLRRQQNNSQITVKRLEQYAKGYEPDDLINRDTNNDFRNSRNLINTKIREMAYELFENDIEDAEEFIVLFNRTFTYENFIPVYNDILKRYKGLKVSPSVVIDTAEKLIDNLENTGSTSLIKNKTDVEDIRNTLNDLKIFVEDSTEFIYENYSNNCDEIKNKIDSLFDLFNVNINSNYELNINNIIQSFNNRDLNNADINYLLEDEKFMSTIKGKNKNNIENLIKTILKRDTFETDELFITNVFNILLNIKDSYIVSIRTKLNKEQVS